MGCGSSKGTAVSKHVVLNLPEKEKKDAKIAKPPSAASVASRQKVAPASEPVEPKSRPESVRKRPGSSKNSRPETGTVSVSGVGVRGASAASALSTKSNDSGIVHDISANDKKTPNHVDSALLLTNNYQTDRLNEQKTLESLRAEGLIDDPSTKTAKAGLTFEVPLNELKVRVRRPPPRLEKIDRNAKLSFTKDQLNEKLAKAEKARKVREQQKIQKNREKDTKNLEIKLALLQFEKKKEVEMGQKLTDNIETHAEKRVRRLENVKERQKLEAKKVDEVKSRKLELSMNSPTMLVDDEEQELMKSKNVPQGVNLDDVPVGSSITTL